MNEEALSNCCGVQILGDDRCSQCLEPCDEIIITNDDDN